MLRVLNWLFQIFLLFPARQDNSNHNHQHQQSNSHPQNQKQINDSNNQNHPQSIYINFIVVMSDSMLDISKIPKLEFQIHNQQLINCIRELDFQSKTHAKHIQKIKKDIESRPTETIVADTFTVINSSIDIDPSLLKHVIAGSNKNLEGVIAISADKLGIKIGQMSQVLRLLFERLQNMEKKVEITSSDTKTLLAQKFNNLQSQLDDFKKTQNKENRGFNETIQLNLNKYEEKLREVQSNTLWQINDCQHKLKDRVNQQFVRDIVKEAEAKITTKLKQSLVKNNIDPQRIDKLQTRCLKLQKEIEIKMVEATSKLNVLKQNVEHSLATKKDLANDKLDSEKKIGNLQVQNAQFARRVKNSQQQITSVKQDLGDQIAKKEESDKQLFKVSKLVANLKISDDFQKLMQNLDPHKICEIDNTLNNLAERDLKIQKQLDAMKRYQQKLKQKVEICNMLNPTDQKAKIDKDEISKIFNELVAGNSTFKKVQTFEGQLYQFKAYGDMINEINKRIGKIQKQFDIQGVIYNLRGLEEYIKKQLLVMTTKINMVEGQMAQEKRRRPISARKGSQGKLTSSISYKKLTPVDCISCFQNPMGQSSPEQRKLFGNKY